MFVDNLEHVKARDGDYEFFTNDTDALEKIGCLNLELAERWLGAADFILMGTLQYPDGEEMGSEAPGPSPEDRGIPDLDADERFERLDDVLLPNPGYVDEYILVYRKISR